ncbi:MAG: hypothetical protein KY433_03305 [Actinobacteria bacterium]|nr:hypothetical protein [Actinomycetota bacterium]
MQALPHAAYPAVIAVLRLASRSALVAFEANHYSVPPAQAGRTVSVLARVGEPVLRIVSAAGEVVATHRRAPADAGQQIRTPEHAAMLEQAVLAAFTTNHACRRKTNRPAGDAALAELASNPERVQALGAAARERVAALSPQRMADRLDALYREVAPPTYESTREPPGVCADRCKPSTSA